MPYRMILLLVILSFIACDKDNVPEVIVEKPSVSITNSSSFEGTSNPNFTFEITIDKAQTEDINVGYTVEGITAIPNVDFISEASGMVTIPKGSFKAELIINIVNDDLNEVEEKMSVTLSEDANFTIKAGKGIGTIKDDDEVVFLAEDGYITPNEYYGYQLAWGDEFDGDALKMDDYNYEYGDNGWGNNELQNYTDDISNSFLADSKLTIRAMRNKEGKYTSARITTQGKKEFKFGRIDVRARLPKGQGIWPAIWMLGDNINSVPWPACGEIDIMELVGHLPKVTYGTAHWGLQGEGSTYLTGAYNIQEDFQEKFHVFSIVWEYDEIVWYVDETQFHRITPNNMNGKPYPFNNEFFFIFNVAIGGNWPGNPDQTTVFPQEMEIDYVRVFQLP